MATATAPEKRQAPKTHSADDTVYQRGEDGYEVRYEEVDGELVPFSLAPYPLSERPVYYIPHNDMGMRFRARLKNEAGFQPTIQKERWLGGAFSPRNAWEEHMTRRWMRRNVVGCADPDKWKGGDHPKGEGHGWRCGCGFFCPNWDVFEQHQRFYSDHNTMRSE